MEAEIGSTMELERYTDLTMTSLILILVASITLTFYISVIFIKDQVSVYNIISLILFIISASLAILIFRIGNKYIPLFYKNSWEFKYIYPFVFTRFRIRAYGIVSALLLMIGTSVSYYESIVMVCVTIPCSIFMYILIRNKYRSNIDMILIKSL